MPDPLRVDAGELTTDEILSALREGRRVVVRTRMLGGEYEVTLRHDGTIFYCDTPTTLHKHEDEAGMRTCIANMGYARTEAAED
jgi:hemin uptake protein HemP